MLKIIDLPTIKSILPKADLINEIDGIKLIWSDKWIHIRKSNTEPIVRFYSESEDPAESKKLIETAKRLFDN